MVSSGKIEIEKFNGQSFELWKLKMEDMLVDKDLWIVVDPDSWDSLVIAIGSNATALHFDEIVSSLLTKEMRRKNMESQNGNALSEGHYKRDCKSKAPNKGKGFDEALSAEVKTTSDEDGDVYLASSSTHIAHEAWLIDSGASFHFTPHREWFCEYEKYDGGDVFLGDDRKARIIGRGKVKLKLQGGRVRTLPGVLHIPTLARNMISVSKLDDAGIKTVFEKDTYKMVRGALVLMRGVRIGTPYKLQGSTVVDGCNSSMVPENGA
eukprot:PITA_36185